jgi:3-hydroxyisobutyrate dehydrogenase-like beta-hydroxyacid dehydrogenase
MPTSHHSRIGWIGLGAMGLPMAARLLSAGHRLTVCAHRDPTPVERLGAAGAEVAASPRLVAAASDVVFTMVRDEPQTDAVVLGDDGVLAAMTPGATLVVMSTLSAAFCQALAARCEEEGVGFLDAPVSGGVPLAEVGKLSIMVGGDEDVLGRVRPLLDLMGDRLFQLGPVGSGQLAKIVNNAIKIGILGLTTEGLSLGVRAGLDRDALLAALSASSASSHVVEHWAYYHQFKVDHRPGGPLEILHKDIGFAIALADEFGVDVPMVRCASEIDVGRTVPTAVEPSADGRPA